MTDAAGLVFQQLHLPRPLELAQVVEALTRLAAEPGRAPLVLETRADATGVRYLVGHRPPEAERLREQLKAAIPGALLTGSGDQPSARREPMQAAARLRLRPAALPIRTDEPEATSRAVLSLSGPFRPGEGLVLQTLLGPTHAPRTLSARAVEPAASLWETLNRRPVAGAETRARLRKRLGEFGFAATIRLGVASRDLSRRRRLLLSLLGALAVTRSPGLRLDLVREPAHRLNQARLPWRWPLHLSVSELAVMLGLPYGDGDLPGLPPVRPRLLRAAVNVHQGPRVFARSAVPGDDRLLGISAADQTFHTIAYGPSGSGKTTALLHLILADIAAGRPVVVLDPKRQLIDDIVARIPAHRVSAVVELNAADAAPIGFNALDVTGRDPDVVVDGILAVFQAVFSDGWGPRTADIFSAGLRTLARASTPSNPATLVDLPRILTDPQARRHWVGRIQNDEALAGFWTWYESQSPEAQAAVIAAPLNKLRQFLLRPALVRLLDQRGGRFRLRDVFRQNKVVLVPLNEGLVGSGTASLLGSLVIAEVWQATQERADLRNPHPGMVYVDEAHRFLNLPVSLADALAVSRSLGVGWILATQYRHQFPTDLRTAVDMNARSKIVFATEHGDAQEFAKLARGLVAEDFMALARFSAYVTLVADGLPSGWALVQTLPPPPATTDPAQVRAAVRAAYGPVSAAESEAGNTSRRPAQQARPAGRIGRKQRQRRPSP